MILGLDEPAGLATSIVSEGPDANVWFDLINQYDNK